MSEAQADEPDRRYDLGRAAPRQFPYAMTEAQMEGLNRGLQQLIEYYARTHIQVGRLAEQLAATIYSAMREFDGIDWAALAELLDAATRSPWSQPVTARTVDDELRLTDEVIAKLNPDSDWWSDWLRARAVLLTSLYLTLSVSAEQVWPDLIANLRDNTIAAIAVYGAYITWEKRHKGR